MTALTVTVERVARCLKCGGGPRLEGHHVGACCHAPDHCHICRPALRHVASSVRDSDSIPGYGR